MQNRDADYRLDRIYVWIVGCAGPVDHIHTVGLSGRQGTKFKRKFSPATYAAISYSRYGKQYVAVSHLKGKLLEASSNASGSSSE